MHIDFSTWNGHELTLAHTFRFPHAPKPVQEADAIASGVNAEHCEGFDNFALFHPGKSHPGAKASIVCSFEKLGCPEIVLADRLEIQTDGTARYGACIEVVLYKDGVNVWRHFMDGDKHVTWHKRLGVCFPVAESEKHTLSVETADKTLIFSVDGFRAELRVEDLFESFHLATCLCEGVGRVSEMTIED